VDKKKAMPFVSVLKKRLDAGEKPETVFNRKLLFDEVQVLKELKPGLKSTVAKLTEVVIVVLDADGKTGTTTDGQKLTELAPVAQSAEPGSPAFEFTNV
jgi:leucyl-tRNA synthetase